MKIIGFVLRLILFVALVLWLSDKPGSVHIEWHDHVIETSAAVLAVLVFLLVYFSLLVHRVWRTIVDTPRSWKLSRTINHLKEGEKELARGFAAVAGGQVSEAGRHAVKARKMLGETPNTRLLLAQAAQLAGDNRAARTVFEAMIEDKDTALLGYRGLIMGALRDGQVDEAMRLIQRVEGQYKNIPWLSLMRFELATRQENWVLADDTLTKVAKMKSLPKTDLIRRQSVTLLAQAKIALRAALPTKALLYAEKAKKLRSDWIPAALVLAEAQILTEHKRAALQTLEKAWRRDPHPDILPLVYWALGEEKPIKIYKYIEKMLKPHADHFYGQMALAEAALRADLWGEARRFLTGLHQRGQATRSTYQLLARLERRERHNENTASLWVAKAVAAQQDPQWICGQCGAAHRYWEPKCPACSAFDSLEWGIPGESHVVKNTPRSVLLLDDRI